MQCVLGVREESILSVARARIRREVQASQHLTGHMEVCQGCSEFVRKV
jgi:hypothetical protein